MARIISSSLTRNRGNGEWLTIFACGETKDDLKNLLYNKTAIAAGPGWNDFVKAFECLKRKDFNQAQKNSIGKAQCCTAPNSLSQYT